VEESELPEQKEMMDHRPQLTDGLRDMQSRLNFPIFSEEFTPTMLLTWTIGLI